MQSRRAFAKLSLAGLAVAATPIASAQAQTGANLNISPRRIVFDAATRSATVLVFNTGQQSATYNVELVDRIMTPEGTILSLTEAAKHPEAADAAARLKSGMAMVTVTPHRVVLGPGESQTIRLRVLRPDTLPAGEYRTHLTVTAVPSQSEGLTAEQAAGQASGGIDIRLTALFAISIPLIVRQGAPDVTAALEGFKLLPVLAGGSAPAALAFDIVRKGSSSLYGSIEVRGSRDDRAAKPLGALSGVGAYPEIDRRAVQVPLRRAPAKGETLQVVFKDEDLKPGQVLATGSFTVE